MKQKLTGQSCIAMLFFALSAVVIFADDNQKQADGINRRFESAAYRNLIKQLPPAT